VLLACGSLTAQTKSTPATSVQKGPTPKLLTVSTHTTSTTKKKSHKSTKASKRGQQKIDPTRAREIQEALIREHYMDGTATGTWDSKSQAAMQRYQADNGWQSKVVPDSRALIKMGLGPDHQHLLNPESAMTSQPDAPHASTTSEQNRGMETPK
jgi:hypothetical protein